MGNCKAVLPCYLPGSLGSRFEHQEEPGQKVAQLPENENAA